MSLQPLNSQLSCSSTPPTLGKRTSASNPNRAQDQRPLKRIDVGDSKIECRVDCVAKGVILEADYNYEHNPLKVKLSKTPGGVLIGGQGKVFYAESGRQSPLVVKSFTCHHSELSRKAEHRALQLGDDLAHGPRLRGMVAMKGSQEEAIVMDRVNGKDLIEFLRDRRAFSECEVLRLIKNILECLRDLKSKGIVHCDIKLDNIIYDPEKKRFTLVDFGSCVGFGRMKEVGTFGYFSPDEILKIPSDYSNDIWALGCTAFFAYKRSELFTMHGSFKDQKERYAASLVNIEKLIGDLPDRILNVGDKTRKLDFLRKKAYLQSVKISTLDERLEGLPDTLKTFIKNMVSYERPPVEEFLNDPLMQEDISFRLGYPNHFKKYDLEIEPEEPLEGGIFPISSVTFSLKEKSSRKICHHVPRSQNGKYRIKLINSSGFVVFEKPGCEIYDNMALRLTDPNPFSA